MISAVVLTKNEEDNIKECLGGLKWCNEILVVDDDSVDKTREIAKKEGARVIKHSLGSNFADQRNFALRQTRSNWVFFVDADERVSPLLAKEIQKEIKNSKNDGFYFKRIDFFMDKWLKHGEIGSIKILRLAKKDSGVWKRSVDEKWVVKGRVKTLKHPLLHFSHLEIKEFLLSVNERTTLNAQEFYKNGARVTVWEWLKPLVKFIQNYFFRFGFLDGTSGLVFAVMMSLHSFLVRGKLYLLCKKDKK